VSLSGKTLFITGASRGIGLAIALRAARDGANTAVAAKTAEPHPKLPGTIHTAAREIEQAGGRALPLVVDVRDEAAVTAAVRECAEHFGGIDICINNASAINLASIREIDMRRYDLIQQINTRGTFLTSRACLPYLEKAANPHILTLSPPLDLRPKWFAGHLAYSLSKYGMSLCMLGLAEEFRAAGIACNAHHHRHRRRRVRARRSADDAPFAQARDRGRRRPRDPEPAIARVHRAVLHRRQRAL